MKSFTLDTNCIIDLEEDRSAGIYTEELKRRFYNGEIEIAVVSVTASENQRSGNALSNYSEFEAKLERVGLARARALAPVNIWELGYYGHTIWAEDELERQVLEIKNILFPQSQHSPPTDSTANSKWRNQMCDVLTAWSHGYYKIDFLVTSDMNFHKKATDLVQFGIRSVVTPDEARELAAL